MPAPAPDFGNKFPSRLKRGLTEKQFKRYRTARRRIRSHFGSEAAISQVSVTVGSKLSERGLLCGFVLSVAGNSGVKGLRASEGYCRPAKGVTDTACSIIHVLRDQYLLQLEQVRTELFVISPSELEFTEITANVLGEFEPTE